MTPDEAKQILNSHVGTYKSATLPLAVLSDLTVAEVPGDASFQIGKLKNGIIHLEWSGQIFKKNDRIVGEADYTWTRKYWYRPIGLEPYLDLVRRAVELRAKTHNDVELTHFEDDGAYIQMTFLVFTDEKNIRRAYEHVRKVCNQLEETAERASDEAGKRIAEFAARISGWGNASLDELLNSIDQSKTTDERGRSLEELI